MNMLIRQGVSDDLHGSEFCLLERRNVKGKPGTERRSEAKFPGVEAPI